MSSGLKLKAGVLSLPKLFFPNSLFFFSSHLAWWKICIRIICNILLDTWHWFCKTHMLGTCSAENASLVGKNGKSNRDQFQSSYDGWIKMDVGMFYSDKKALGYVCVYFCNWTTCFKMGCTLSYWTLYTTFLNLIYFCKYGPVLTTLFELYAVSTFLLNVHSKDQWHKLN